MRKPELEHLSEDDREEVEYLLNMGREYSSSRKTFMPTAKDIQKRAEEKGISFDEARREILKEVRIKQMEMVSKAKKLIKPQLSKKLRQRVGIKDAGRQLGSKNKNIKYSKIELNTKLEEFITNYFNGEGEEPTQEIAAKALGLGYAKALQRLRKSYGDERDWRIFVREVLEKQE